jgi:hypothetical protein
MAVLDGGFIIEGATGPFARAEKKSLNPIKR